MKELEQGHGIVRMEFKGYVPKFLHKFISNLFTYVEIEYDGVKVWVKPQYEVGYQSKTDGGSGGTGK